MQAGFPTLTLNQSSYKTFHFNSLICDLKDCPHSSGCKDTIFYGTLQTLMMWMPEKYLNLHTIKGSQWCLLLSLFQLHFCVLICPTLKTQRPQLTARGFC